MSSRRSDDRHRSERKRGRSRSPDRRSATEIAAARAILRVRELEAAKRELELRLDEQRATRDARVIEERTRLNGIEKLLKADNAKNIADHEKIVAEAEALRKRHDEFAATLLEREKKIAERERAVREREMMREAKAIAGTDARTLELEVKCVMLAGKVEEQSRVIKGARHMRVILERTQATMQVGIDGLNKGLSAEAAKKVMQTTLDCIRNNVAAFEASIGPDTTPMAVRTLPPPKKSCLKRVSPEKVTDLSESY